jgi:hypothetical protein
LALQEKLGCKVEWGSPEEIKIPFPLLSPEGFLGATFGPWPDLKGLYLINGFSAHGRQQSPAAGRYFAGIVLKRPPALDLSCFSPQRILDNRPLEEAGVV